jgi:outer membrane receptor for ferrienterochelin and colicins
MDTILVSILDASELLQATAQPYVEALETQRYDAGAVGQFLVKDRYVVTARAAIARQSHDHQFGEIFERDRHDTAFGETAVRGTAGRQTWVAGFAIERDAYTARDVPRFDYDFVVRGAFAQYDVTVSPKLSLSGSARLDHHSEYGTFFSGRVSALARAGHWTSRLSVGTGFFGPTPITEETEAAGLTRLEVRGGLPAEKQFGRIRLFVNGENLTGVRQTRWDPLLLPTRAVDGRWTVDAWAPLEGRNINGGLGVRF